MHISIKQGAEIEKKRKKKKERPGKRMLTPEEQALACDFISL